jgi:plastocyanin domain-containing protein
MNKPTLIAVIFALVFVTGAFLLSQKGSSTENGVPANNVSLVDGQQIIDITVKGGYSPRTSTAKAGVPTILRFHTRGTFDCSSSIRIPSMGVSQTLSPTGTYDVAISDPQPGALQGMCGMGMYPFTVNFQS